MNPWSSSIDDFDFGEDRVSNLPWLPYLFLLCELYCGLVAVSFFGLVVAFVVLFTTLTFFVGINAIGHDFVGQFVTIGLPMIAFVFSIGSALWMIRCASKVFDRFHRGVGDTSGSFNPRRYIHLIPLLIVHRAKNVPRLLSIPMGILWIFCFLLSLFVRHVINDCFRGLDVSLAAQCLLIALTYLSLVFACNIYLALAIGVVFRNRFLTRMIWRSRFVFDFMVVMFAMLG